MLIQTTLENVKSKPLLQVHEYCFCRNQQRSIWAEFGAILERGYVRLLVARESSQNALAEDPDDEAPCQPVNTERTPDRKEPA